MTDTTTLETETPTTDAVETTALGSPVEDKPDTTSDAPADKVEDAPVVKAPEKYELALEGVDLDADTLSAAEPIFRELNLSNEEAAKLLPVAKGFADKIGETLINELVQQGQANRQSWLTEAKADPEIGGAKWDESLHLAAKGFDAIGFKDGHPFRQALEETGFGNNVHMIQLVRKLGELVSEDGSFERGDAALKVENVAAQLYPNDVKG